MSNFKKKQSVRPEHKIKKIGGIVFTEGSMPNKNVTGLFPDFTAAERPSPTNLPDGIVIINTTTNKLNYTKDGIWVEL
jgi:hypothetical protein